MKSRPRTLSAKVYFGLTVATSFLTVAPRLRWKTALAMKCQKCDKLATFHITDLSGDQLLALHLCAECVKEYLQPEETPPPQKVVSKVISKQLKLEQTTEELAELDHKECPVCGISFYEFRQGGRLGCPNDYVFFSNELEPLLNNVHGGVEHVGKKPLRGSHDTQPQTELIKLRREMKEAVDREDYELASELRDRIKSVEGESSP